MYCRRMVFLGVTLPQLSTGGIAAAVFWHLSFHQQQPSHSDFLLALLGSTIVTTGTLLLLAAMERRGHDVVEGRIGTVYVLAGAVTILLLASERVPEVGIVTLLRGQIIAISDMDMVILLVSYAVIVSLLALYRRELFLVSVDRDMALSLGKKLWVWDMLLYALVGLTISLGVLMVGPLLTFAFLLIPTMIAIRVAKRFFLVPLLGGFHRSVCGLERICRVVFPGLANWGYRCGISVYSSGYCDLRAMDLPSFSSLNKLIRPNAKIFFSPIMFSDVKGELNEFVSLNVRAFDFVPVASPSIVGVHPLGLGERLKGFEIVLSSLGPEGAGSR